MHLRILILGLITLGVTLVLSVLYIVSRTLRDFSVLHAEYSVEEGDIGIPGVTKMYDARLVNRGRTPVRIEVCAFLSDASANGEAVAYSVQKYEANKAMWMTIVDASDARTCRPYPLGWATAQLKTKWLWPGQSVSMGEEATAARGFHKGESARFLLFTSFKHPGELAPEGISTPAFLIDEEPGEGAEGLRFRH
jgi:hypothetical protein